MKGELPWLPRKTNSALFITREPPSMMDAAIDELLAAGWAKDEIAPLLIEIKDRLRRNPLSFGEPIFTIRPIKLTVCVGFVRPLSVQIGIQEELRIVFIRNVTLMTTDKD